MPFTEQPLSADNRRPENRRPETAEPASPTEFLEEKKTELQAIAARFSELEGLVDHSDRPEDPELAAIREEEASLVAEWQEVAVEVAERGQLENADENWRQAAAEMFGVEDFDLEQFKRSSLDDEGVRQSFAAGRDWNYIFDHEEEYISGYSYEAANEAFLAMDELEKEMPGSVARLNKEFGIINFQRYPKEMLLGQLQAGEAGKEAALLVFAASDWNGAFDNQQEIWRRLFEEQRASRNFRIAECRTAADLKTQLEKARQAAGQPLSFLALSAHSELDGFTLGHEEDENRGFVSQEELASLQLNDYLAPDAQLLANACSSAALQGWARGISKDARLQVVGPDRPAGIEDLDFVGQEVVPKYYDEAIYSKYSHGFLLNKKRGGE